MKGYMVEIRPKNDLNTVVGTGSLVQSATPLQRFKMAKKLMDKSPYGDYLAIEYNADWTDCTNPVYKEIKRYELDEQTGLPVGDVDQHDALSSGTDPQVFEQAMAKISKKRTIIDDDQQEKHIAPPVTPPPGD